MTKEKKMYELYGVLRVGDEWEMKLEKTTYITNSKKVFESLNKHQKFVQNIVNWFRAYEEPLSDYVLDRLSYEKYTNNTNVSTYSDKFNIKSVVLWSRNNPRFTGIRYYGYHRLKGSFSTSYEIDLFLLVVSSPEHVLGNLFPVRTLM